LLEAEEMKEIKEWKDAPGRKSRVGSILSFLNVLCSLFLSLQPTPGLSPAIDSWPSRANISGEADFTSKP
jgi:hypothetical protein